MGGKRNKNKKFLREKHKKHNANQNKKNKKEEVDHAMKPAPSKKDTQKMKKSKQLFNAGINALNEQPEIDVGLQFQKSDAVDPDLHHDADDDLYNDALHHNDHLDDGNLSDSADFAYGGGSEMDTSDVISLQSEVTIIDEEILNLSDKQHLIDNEIDDLLDDLTDKDSNVRIQSLLKLNNALRTRRTNECDFTEKNQRLSTLCKNLAGCIRKGSVNERLHALDTVGLMALCLNEGLDFFIKYFQSMMKTLIQKPKSAAVQTKAMNIWAIMVWSLGADGSGTKLNSLKMFEYFWNYNLRQHADEEDEDEEEYEEDDLSNYGESKEEKADEDDEEDGSHSNDEPKRASTEILCTALDAWLFLICSVGSASQIGLLLDEYCPSLLQLLRLESSTVLEKIHIGKALTVLIGNYHDALENDGDFEEQEVNLNAVMDEFNHLKANSKLHRKKEFLSQKAKFRDYLKTLEHKWTPLIVIKLHHKKFEISGWNDWVQYHGIKQILLNGLQAHLLQNEKIKSAFSIEVDAEFKMASKSEKKTKRQQNIEKDRNTKTTRSKRRDNKRGFMFDKTLIE
eukprot:CAMPEP_0197029798 /NCGR_PEP_ID=MMETSP1384-20130603/9174_1 /TAXON_ID=29189 /ORGANISM="Ammonia sp." /LENGTH=566 /DNA_ID=CAMNT_0042459035 /DNA_START=84 /DNA_END=1784 /DNA_ORIENTATION=-